MDNQYYFLIYFEKSEKANNGQSKNRNCWILLMDDLNKSFHDLLWKINRNNESSVSLDHAN
jgi:hypothetical protein